MAKALQRTPVPAPAFIRLLARLTDVDIRPSGDTVADRLGEWIDWTRAVALSNALDGPLPEAATDVPGDDGDEGRECARARASLMTAITADAGAVTTKWRSARPTSDEYAVFRERYLDLQQSMQAETGRLRGQLRDRLSRTSADLARLAEVDAVMELTLSPREHTLLAAVPTLLGHHFDRLRAAGVTAQAGPQSPTDADAAGSGTWLGVFRQDMQNVLIAELDVRFHPVEGLLAALQTR